MHLSTIVLSCAAVPTCLAVALARSRWQSQHDPLRGACAFALGYTACVGYLVALASTDLLARTSTKLLGKYSNGRIHPLSWILFLPYHVGLRIKLGVQRLISDEPLYNKVLPGWYIGGWPRAGAELPSDAPSVLDCTCELPRTHRNRYLCLPVWDTQVPPMSLVDRGVAFALAERSQGRSVYVHCAHGHGRSALLLLACLLEARQVGSCEEGLALLQAARPRVHLNARQRVALEAWARARGFSVGGAGHGNGGGGAAACGGGGGGGALQMHSLTPVAASVVCGVAGAGGAGGNGVGVGAGGGGGAVRLVAEATGHTTAAATMAAVGHTAGSHGEVAAALGLGEGLKKLS